MFVFIAVALFVVIFVQIGHLKTRVKMLENQLREKGAEVAAPALQKEQSAPTEPSAQEEAASPAQDISTPSENVLPDADPSPQPPQPVMAAAVEGASIPAAGQETAGALSQTQEQKTASFPGKFLAAGA